MAKNNVMLSNETALRRGAARAAWKRNITYDYFSNVKYDLKALPFDHRDLNSLIPLLVDISSVANESEEIQKEYFMAKLKVIEQDFVLTKDPSTRLPYLKKMYDIVCTHTDIDWDDEAQIDHLFCSTAAQQMLGTMVERLPQEVLSLFPTPEDIARLDNISSQNYINTEKFRNAISRTDPTLNLNMKLNSVDEEGPFHGLQEDIARATANATDNGTVATFDPTLVSKDIKKLFLGDEISVEQSLINPRTKEVMDTNIYTAEDFHRNILEMFEGVSSSTINELRLVDAYTFKGRHRKSDLLLINGETATELVERKTAELIANNEKDPVFKARQAVGKMILDAMLDGQSIVSIMRPKILQDGKVSFTHQVLNVDLDKLNKIERDEKHNAFRRALDYFKIWKIKPKYASNETRDANQRNTKLSENYKNILANAEKKFISVYNEHSKERRDEDAIKLEKGEKVDKNNFFEKFPVISNAKSQEDLDAHNSSLNADVNDRVKLFDNSNPNLEIDSQEHTFDNKVDEKDIAQAANLNNVVK